MVNMLTNGNMKKTIAATIILFLLSSSVTLAGTIIGSPHDFRGYQWNRSGEICLPCHAPHFTKTLPAPLWNHDLPTQTYIMYGKTHTPTMDAEPGSLPDGMSKICLSCHDGIIAPETYGRNPGRSAHLYGKDLTSSVLGSNHPISFIYDSALAMKERDLYDPSTKLSGLPGSTGTITEDKLLYDSTLAMKERDLYDSSTKLSGLPGSTGTIAKDMLFSNRMECSSCHDVHNRKAAPGTKLLVKDNAGSALCLTCHNK
jgi:predicted CXXCH cytochrome family protein